MTTKVSLEVLKDNSVTEAKLASSSVTEAKLASNSVTASKIAAGAVGASEIADGAVGSSELASGAVTNAKVASGIDAAKLTGTLPAIDGSNLTGVEADIFAGATYQTFPNVQRGVNYTNNYGKTILVRAHDSGEEGYTSIYVGGVEVDSADGWVGALVPPGAVWRLEHNSGSVVFEVRILR